MSGSRHIPRGKLVLIDPVCVECGGMAKLVDGASVRPDRPDDRGKMFWRCKCGAFVGCHPGTAIAMGHPASGQTRYLRFKAHEALDASWGKDGRARLASGYARKRAYKRLAAAMGLRSEDCHIGFMSAAQCRRVIAICESWARGKAA
jgi:hypothetical protein